MITLKLTKEQVTVLSIILDHIGGSPSKSGRKYADEIARELNQTYGRHSLGDEEKYVVSEPDENAAGIWFEEMK